jgi:enoyl-CoA hydratase/carnithine racemase
MAPPSDRELQNSVAQILLREDQRGVATLTMNRPAVRNALSMELMNSLQSELDAISSDASVKVLILKGAGPAFCSGHDLREMRANPERAFIEKVFQACSRLVISIATIPQPVIAQVHGSATAAGCQLVAACDLAVCEEGAQFATPGVNIGLFCSTPMVALSRAVSRKAAMEMLFTGVPIDASRALQIGLVNRVVPTAELSEAVRSLADLVASKSSRVVAIGKEAFGRQIELSLEQAYSYAADVMVRNMMMFDAEEGIDAFLQKRQPNWRD